MASPSPPSALRLYRQLIKQGKQFHDYNWQAFAHRKITTRFRSLRGLSDPSSISSALAAGSAALAALERQVAVANLYFKQQHILQVRKKYNIPEEKAGSSK